MRRLITSLVLALASFVMPAVEAFEHAEFDCGYDSISQEAVTGQDTYRGVAYGYVMSPEPGEPVSVRCWVQVNGDRVAETPIADGIQVAVAQGAVTFAASRGDIVLLCTDWTAGAESGSYCPDPPIGVPPDGGPDVKEGILQLVADLTWPLEWSACSMLRTEGVPDLVNAAAATTGVWVDPDDCDVWVGGDQVVSGCAERVYDVVPYQDPYSGPGRACSG